MPIPTILEAMNGTPGRIKCYFAVFNAIEVYLDAIIFDAQKSYILQVPHLRVSTSKHSPFVGLLLVKIPSD